MMKRILALTMALALALCLLPGPARAQEDSQETTPQETTWETTPEETQPEETEPEETQPEETWPEETQPEETQPEETEPEETEPELPRSVKVTLTVAGVDCFAASRQTGILAAEAELEVPWFDLAPYGISGDAAGITLNHLLICATEQIFCGLDLQDVGQGYLGKANLPDALDLTADPQRLWGWEGQVLCFLDDQAAELTDPLEEGSRVTLAVLSPETEGQIRPAALALSEDALNQGDPLILTTEPLVDVFYISMEEGQTPEGDIRRWYFAGTAGDDGILEVPTDGIASGEYLFAVAPGQGEEVLLPQARQVTVEECPQVHQAQMGDINGDGVVDALDAACLSGYINGRQELTGEALRLADLNGDGKINILDVALIYRACNTAPDGAQ